MRLTADILKSALVYTNPLNQRELSLRAYQLTSIEHLGVFGDVMECIDISDNRLTKLENFPLMNALVSLIATNNSIAAITSSLSTSLPNIESLVLSSNQLTALEELVPLQGLRRLQCLIVRNNPVASHEHYRPFLIHLLPQLKVLDFAKVKQRERDAAQLLAEQGKFQSLLLTQSNASGRVIVDEKAKIRAQIATLMDAISAANSIDEINHLEQQLTKLTEQLESTT